MQKMLISNNLQPKNEWSIDLYKTCNTQFISRRINKAFHRKLAYRSMQNIGDHFMSVWVLSAGSLGLLQRHKRKGLAASGREAPQIPFCYG